MHTAQIQKSESCNLYFLFFNCGGRAIISMMLVFPRILLTNKEIQLKHEILIWCTRKQENVENCRRHHINCILKCEYLNCWCVLDWVEMRIKLSKFLKLEWTGLNIKICLWDWTTEGIQTSKVQTLLFSGSNHSWLTALSLWFLVQCIRYPWVHLSTYGLPHGSVLAPLLFILYTSDLSGVLGPLGVSSN